MDNKNNRIASTRVPFGRGPLDAQMPSRQFSPSLPVPQSDLNIRHIIRGSFSLMGQNAVTFLALIAAAAVPERVAYHLVGEDSLLILASPLLTALCCIVLYGSVFDGATRTLANQSVSFGGCLRAGLHSSMSAFAAIGITVLAIWFLLIVPGIGLATRWAVAAPAAIAEDKPLRAAFARSVTLTAHCRAQVRVLVLLLAALAISRAFTMMPLWGEPVEALPVFFFANWLLPLLLTTFSAAAGAALYHALTEGSPAPDAAL